MSTLAHTPTPNQVTAHSYEKETEYQRALANLCDRYQITVISDEVRARRLLDLASAEHSSALRALYTAQADALLAA